MEDQVLAMLRGQLAAIILGAVFLFIGFAASSIAAIRRRSGVHIFVWLGIWSAMYGTVHLSQSPAIPPYSEIHTFVMPQNEETCLIAAHNFTRQVLATTLTGTM